MECLIKGDEVLWPRRNACGASKREGLQIREMQVCEPWGTRVWGEETTALKKDTKSLHVL